MFLMFPMFPMFLMYQLCRMYYPRVAQRDDAQLVGVARVVAVPDLVVVYFVHEQKRTNRIASRLA